MKTFNFLIEAEVNLIFNQQIFTYYYFILIFELSIKPMIINYYHQANYFYFSYHLLNFFSVFLSLLCFLVMGLLFGCHFYFRFAFRFQIQDYFILFIDYFMIQDYFILFINYFILFINYFIDPFKLLFPIVLPLVLFFLLLIKIRGLFIITMQY